MARLRGKEELEARREAWGEEPMARRRKKRRKGDAQDHAGEEPDRLQQEAGDVVQGLGLRRIRHTVELTDTPATRGMIHKVRHLVTVVASS